MNVLYVLYIYIYIFYELKFLILSKKITMFLAKFIMFFIKIDPTNGTPSLHYQKYSKIVKNLHEKKKNYIFSLRV